MGDVTAADDPGTGHLRQRARAELEILLPMRLQDVGDGKVVFTGQLQIFVNIAARVDHHSEPVSARQDVGVLSQAGCF